MGEGWIIINCPQWARDGYLFLMDVTNVKLTNLIRSHLENKKVNREVRRK